MVDGAHAVGHFRFAMPDLHCDFYGSSLHKWLSTPLGAGLLWVKKENIGKVWPLLGDGSPVDDIAHLNHIGTHPAATDLAISDAIDFYNMVGPQRKEERLRYLQNYWTSRVKSLPHIVMNTPVDEPARSCGIANVGVKGMKASEVANKLLTDYKIYTVPIDGQNVNGCRITPNLYTTLADLDVFVGALKAMKL